MKLTAVGWVCALLLLPAAGAEGQSWKTPADSERCPSKWGSADERGSANHMKPETVLRAARLIRTGEVIELGHVLSSLDASLRRPPVPVDTKRTTMNPQSNRRGSNEELVVTELGQVGTQFDGFSHQTIGNSVYNCFKLDEIASRTGFTKLGHSEVGRAHDARCADRRGGPQRRRHACRRVRDYGRRSSKGA